MLGAWRVKGLAGRGINVSIAQDQLSGGGIMRTGSKKTQRRRKKIIRHGKEPENCQKTRTDRPTILKHPREKKALAGGVWGGVGQGLRMSKASKMGGGQDLEGRKGTSRIPPKRMAM